MAAARYWRVVGIETYGGGDLELSELQLFGSGARVDASAGLTSSHAPTIGALASLKDNSTATACLFAGEHVRSAGFNLMWDFGTPTDVSGVRPGAGALPSKYLAKIVLQYLDAAGQWVTSLTVGRFIWPGPATLDATPAEGDSSFANVALLLRGDGVDGSTTIPDASPTQKTAAAYSGARISTTVSKFGGASIFGGNANGARVMIPAHADLDMGAGDFTVEAWVYRVAASSGFEYIVSHRTTTGYHAFHLYIDVSTKRLEFSICNTAASIFRVIDSAVFPTGRWVHVAGVRLANTIRLYVDGTERASAAVSGAVFGPTDPAILFGTSDGDSRFQFNGYLDEVRITKGLARYTGSFTPPSAAFPTAIGAGGQTFGPLSIQATRPSRAGLMAAATVPVHVTRSALGALVARDIEFGGQGTVYGTTKTRGTPNLPTKARVVLQHQRSKLPVRETWSDPITGAFAFTGIDTSQQFLTLAEDADGHFRPVAANRLTPEVL